MRATLYFLAFLALLALSGLVLERQLPRVEPRFAVAFSAAQARYLDLDAMEVYRAILRDLKPGHIRLQANWNAIEPKPGEFDFNELDKLVSEAGAAGATVTMAVGRKLPRWPECHDPSWLSELKPWEIEARQFTMLRRVVEHYRANITITRWQLENEPLFGYGRCSVPNFQLLKRERNLLYELDPTRPILITDAGELSPWLETALLASQQGVTMYRVTWDPLFGYFHYPWPPAFYRLKAALISPFVQRVVVSELQMEPWSPHGLNDLSVAEAGRSFTPERFWKNVAFVRATGLPEAFTWGAEWWYYERQLGRPTYWESAKVLFSTSAAR